MDPELKKDLNLLDRTLHAANLSTRNRLLSVVKDAKFVKNIRENHYADIPIIPNERCGRWYVPNAEFEGLYLPSYFKSTDGHTNNWSISTRRLNLHLLKQIRENNGIMIVDSTRRGKKIPDSFSKTIPIWIAIIKKFIAPDKSFDELFMTPIETVSTYEHERILDLLPDFYDDMNKYKDLVYEKIIEIGDKKTLRPFWIYPGIDKVPIFLGTEPFYPIILVSASEQSQDGENKMHGYTYVQGAGDDHELWSRNLTPALFWDNFAKFDNLKNMTDDDVDGLVDLIVTQEKMKISEIEEEDKNKCNDKFWRASDIVRVNELLYFGKVDRNLKFDKSQKYLDFDTIIVLESTFECNVPEEEEKKIFKFDLESKSKKSAKLLREKLPGIMDIVKNRQNAKTLVLCNSGEDLSAAVILCCLNLNVDKLKLSKETLRRDLIKLMDLKRLNLQRATLNSVNSFLLS